MSAIKNIEAAAELLAEYAEVIEHASHLAEAANNLPLSEYLYNRRDTIRGIASSIVGGDAYAEMEHEAASYRSSRPVFAGIALQDVTLVMPNRAHDTTSHTTEAEHAEDCSLHKEGCCDCR
jgi:hypothetical protein